MQLAISHAIATLTSTARAGAAEFAFVGAPWLAIAHATLYSISYIQYVVYCTAARVTVKLGYTEFYDSPPWPCAPPSAAAAAASLAAVGVDAVGGATPDATGIGIIICSTGTVL